MSHDPQVHFRYRDSVELLIGRTRYRYEVIRQSEVLDMIRYLRSKGFDDFHIRSMGSLDLLKPVCDMCGHGMEPAGSLEVCSACGANRVLA